MKFLSPFPLLALFLAFFLSIALSPPSEAQEKDVLLGVVNMGEAIYKSKDGLKAVEKVKKRYDQLNSKITEQNNAFQKKVDELTAKAPNLSEDELKKEREVLEAALEVLQKDAATANETLEKLTSDNYGPLYDKAVGLVSNIAEKKGLQAVLEKEGEDSAVIYSAKNAKFVDITEDLVKAMDGKK